MERSKRHALGYTGGGAVMSTPQERPAFDVWQQTVTRMRESGAIATREYHDWFAKTYLISDDGRQVVVGAPDGKTVVEYRQRHYKMKVYDALREIGRPDATVTFRVNGAAVTPIQAGRDDQLTLQLLSEIEPESVDWLWAGRIAAGKITLIVGDPGLGKSWVALDAAARVSAGAVWPDRAAAAKGHVLLLDAENGLADTVRPRIDLLRGDPRRITVMPRTVRSGDGERSLSLSDLDVFRAAIVRTKARLLVIDPLTAYLGATDSHREAEVRAVLSGLQQLAESTDCALVGVMHRAKGAPRDAVLTAIGSVAFAAAARVVFLVAHDPEAPGRKLFGAVKTNMASAPPPLAYRLTDAGLRWDRSSIEAFDAERLLTADTADDRSEREDAEQILRRLLKKGSVIDAKAAMAEAAACCIAPRHMRRIAHQKFGLRSRRIGGVGDVGKWVWELPRARRES